LAQLVGLSLAANLLQIHQFGNSGMDEEMVAARHPHEDALRER